MLLLSGPGASGSRPMAGGESQQPGGWNRVVLRVADLPAQIDALQNAGVRFRNQMEVGPGGRQIQVEDPDGNPIELFEPARRLIVGDTGDSRIPPLATQLDQRAPARRRRAAIPASETEMSIQVDGSGTNALFTILPSAEFAVHPAGRLKTDPLCTNLSVLR